MTLLNLAMWRVAAISGVLIISTAFVAQASAQFNPPSTVFGSISDAAGPVDAGVTVEAYIDGKVCGTKGRTEFTGEGSSRVTVYVVDVVSESQTVGCGKDGKDIKVKVGDRFADQTAKWSPGPVQLDLTFGNATPVAIPTFTPAPTRTPDPSGTAVPAQNTLAPGQIATIPSGSPGAGSPVPTLGRGGITSATPGAQAATGGSDDGGVPFWAIALLVLGGLGAVGGGVGYVMSRNRNASVSDDLDGPLE
ncbi:MAG: hypothetical protein ABI577_04515 [bacterium]